MVRNTQTLPYQKKWWNASVKRWLKKAKKLKMLGVSCSQHTKQRVSGISATIRRWLLCWKLPENWDAELPTYDEGESQASRVSSKEVIQELSKAIPSFWGGSADLSGSKQYDGDRQTKISRLNIMKAATVGLVFVSLRWHQRWNGIQCMVVPGSMGNILCLCRLLATSCAFRQRSKTRQLFFVLTHDSVAVGEDGPTHEPVEQWLRLSMPVSMSYVRRTGTETRAAWKVAMESTGYTNDLSLESSKSTSSSNNKKKWPDDMVKKVPMCCLQLKGNNQKES